MSLFIRLMICISVVGVALYKYIDKLNDLTELRMSIPLRSKELKDLNEKNQVLMYEIESFESPQHLMELARKPELGHLRPPPINEVIILPSTPNPP